MKKLIFGLMATVFFGMGANAQDVSSTAKKALMNAQIITIVEASKVVHAKGMSYDDFVKDLLLPSPTYPSQDKFFRTVYKYVNSNTPSCDIFKADHPEFENYLTDLANN
jgi:hypothetical protein